MQNDGQKDYVSSSSETGANEPAAQDNALRARNPLVVPAVIFSLVMAGCIFVATKPAPVLAAWDQLVSLIELRSDKPPVAASPAVFSEHELERLGGMHPQDQAILLLQATVNHYSGAIDQVPQYLETWRGHLQHEARLDALVNTALNANDLRVRAAAVEIALAQNGLEKNDAAVDGLLAMIEQSPKYKPYALWSLGLLANRGIQHDRVLQALTDHLNDGEVESRRWAVEGMAHIGSDDTIAPLLDRFHNDPSPEVRERAACSLAQSGMLDKEQRMKAVPEILKYLDDPSLDAQTQGWAYQALRDITEQHLPNDPAAWRNWYSSRLSGN